MPKGAGPGRRKGVHPGKECGPCNLCYQTSYEYCHLKTWGEETRDRVKQLCGAIVSDVDCICRKCEKDIKNNMDREGYTPRWMGRKVGSKNCLVIGCNNTMSIIHTQVFSAAKVADTLDVQVAPQSMPAIALCKIHYNEMHRRAQTDIQMKCYTCQCTIVGKARHCPNTALVNELFSDLDVNITEDDYICTSCYNHHLDLVHKDQFNSRDAELLELVEGMPAPTIETKKHSLIVTAALRDVVKKLGRILLQREGVLLPELYRFYVYQAVERGESKIAESVFVQQLPKAVFLSYLAGYFGKHLVWECKQRSCGILLYRRGADLALLLSKALKLLQTTSHSFLSSPEVHSEPATGDEEEAELTKVLARLNQKIHKQIATITREDAKSPYDTSTFNLEACIQSIDPVLWKMIVMLTRSQTESQKNTTPTQMSHTRKVRCLYTLCVLLFNTNRCCSMPMHVLLTDLVDAQGGSIELIRTLNKLGAVASADTQQRHVQFVVEKKLKEGLTLELNRAFWAVSVDNLDFLKPHAFVFSGDQTRSVHCTTVQGNCFMVDSAREQPTSETGMQGNGVDGGETPVLCDSDPDTLHNESSQTGNQAEADTYTESPQSPTVKSPPFKKVRRRSRTSKETKSTHYHIQSPPELRSYTPLHPLQRVCHNHYSSLVEKSMSDFKVSAMEEKELKKFRMASFFYMLLTSQKHLRNHSFLSFLESIFPHTPLQSKAIYLDVLDQNADSQETIGDVVSRLHKEFRIGEDLEHLLVAGDAKTFAHLQKLKLDYGAELSWLVPFIGDFHVLKNYHPILQKIYFDAGLKQVASACGYRAETLTSLENSSHFKKTHHFFMQAWEAFYLLMVDLFCNSTAAAVQHANEFNAEVSRLGLKAAFQASMKKIEKVQEEFATFVQAKVQADPNWKFWEDFVSTNCLCYVALYSAIRSGNWSLRLGAIKAMAPLFCAFDRPTYRMITPQHLADCLLFPSAIEDKLKAGCFSVSITCKPWKSVGLDEAHEMLINKDCKMAVVHPNSEFLNRMATYFPYRSKAMHNLNTQIRPKRTGILDDLHIDSRDRKMKLNIAAMKDALIESNSLPSCHAEGQPTLRNSFTAVSATTTQQHDLLNFRGIGEKHFTAYVERVYLGKKSTKQLKYHKLKTFSTVSRVTKRSYKNLEREKNHVTKCLKRRLLSGDRAVDVREQYLELPRAISDPEGIPQKGMKCLATKFLQAQYGETAVLTNFPPNWLPHAVILEGMFLINTAPLRIHRSMLEYTRWLLQKYTLKYFSAGAVEVHIVFDNPGRLGCHPKDIERGRRDANTKGLLHTHCTFVDEAKIPTKWQSILECRECKRKLVLYLGDCMLLLAPDLLGEGQKLVVAGAFGESDQDCAWSTTCAAIELPEEDLKSNGEEADTRLWLHVKHSAGTNKLVFSPDTDVYHIGLTNTDLISNSVIVQINPIGHSLKLVHLNGLRDALEQDEDLGKIPANEKSETLQVLYAATGCDFTSFFAGISKVAFLKTFYKYVHFVSSETTAMPGSLTDINPDSNGFLAFLRLVGVAYFDKNHQAFPNHTPTTYFDTFQNLSNGDAISQHEQWYMGIRAKVWERVVFEEHLPPTIEALRFHWMRTMWTIDYWRQATAPQIVLLPVELFGWETEHARISVEWDTKENLQEVKDRVSFLIHGCGCKTGCKTGRCKCFKAGNGCGPGCKCTNCQNISSKDTDMGNLQSRPDPTACSPDHTASLSELPSNGQNRAGECMCTAPSGQDGGHQLATTCMPPESDEMDHPYSDQDFMEELFLEDYEMYEAAQLYGHQYYEDFEGSESQEDRGFLSASDEEDCAT